MKRLKPALSLEEFLFRQRVLQTYRHVMRLAYKHHERQDLCRFAREEFRLNQNATLSHRKYLLHTGTSKIEDMARVLGL